MVQREPGKSTILTSSSSLKGIIRCLMLGLGSSSNSFCVEALKQSACSIQHDGPLKIEDNTRLIVLFLTSL